MSEPKNMSDSKIQEQQTQELQNQATTPGPWSAEKTTALIVLSDGTIIEGQGAGAEGIAIGEICFNTAMTGYQEILTDPSYADQIITFTFPHVGNVGTNREDNETSNMEAPAAAKGAIMKAPITGPSNYRAESHLDSWMKHKGIVAITGVDTRALTGIIRDKGMQNGLIVHNQTGEFDHKALVEAAAAWAGIEGADLAKNVTTSQTYDWQETTWQWPTGFGTEDKPEFNVVALDCGTKSNIFRCLATEGCKVTVLPASTSAKDILALNPDGIFLSNGPGDPAATGEYVVPEMQKLVESGKPVFGICLGHQILARTLGASTMKMAQGHHGANHPVKDHTTGKVEITSMNHGFTVDRESLPDTVEETHVSLFDGTNCGIRLKGKPVFSVQYHPEASPGPQDSHYLFRRFVNFMRSDKGLEPISEHPPVAFQAK